MVFINQPFRGSSLHRFSAVCGRGHFFRSSIPKRYKNYNCIRKSSNKAGFEACAASSTKLFPQEQRSGLPVAGRLKNFQKNWKKLTRKPQVLELVECYQIPFSSKPKQTKPLNPVHLTKREESLLNLDTYNTYEREDKTINASPVRYLWWCHHHLQGKVSCKVRSVHCGLRSCEVWFYIRFMEVEIKTNSRNVKKKCYSDGGEIRF